MFHNPMVRPVDLGGSALPKASMIAVKVTGKTCTADSRLRIAPWNVGNERVGGCSSPPLAPIHSEKDGHRRQCVWV